MKTSLRNSIIIVFALIFLGVGLFTHYILEKISIGVEWTPSKSQTVKYPKKYVKPFAVIRYIGISPLEIPEAEVKLTYPRTMRRNETKEVKLEHTFVDKSRINKELPSLVAKLYSSAFDVAPLEQIKKTQLPNVLSTITWIITPKNEGKHLLMLSLSYSEENNFGFRDKTFKLVVRVLTIWGVSGLTYYILRGVLIFIGFVIVYPLFVDWVRKLISRIKAKVKS